MAKRKTHQSGLTDLLKSYAASRTLDFVVRKGGVHLSIIDPDFSRVDAWLTGKYHIVYNKTWRITDSPKARSRTHERGTLPIQKVEIGRFLDRIFYLADVIEEQK